MVDFKGEMSLLREARDIRDELQIIDMVFQHQQKAFKDFCSMMKVEKPPFNVAPLIETIRSGALTIEDQASATSSAVRIIPVLSEPDNVRRAVAAAFSQVPLVDFVLLMNSIQLNELIDFKHKFSNVLEARWARCMAEEASRQGNTLLVFTIVTIIFVSPFSPLSCQHISFDYIQLTTTAIAAPLIHGRILRARHRRVS